MASPQPQLRHPLEHGQVLPNCLHEFTETCKQPVSLERPTPPFVWILPTDLLLVEHNPPEDKKANAEVKRD